MPSRPRLAALLSAAVAALAGAACASPLARGFPWLGPAGAPLAFSQGAGWAEGAEGSFGRGRLANEYRLAKAYAPEAGRCLELSVASRETAGRASLRLALGGPEDRARPLVQASFPLLAAAARYYLPLAAGARISWLSVRIEDSGALDAGGEGDLLRILRVAEVEGFLGYRAGAEGLRVSSGFSLAAVGQGLLASVDGPFALAGAGAAGGGGWALVLEYEGAPPGSRLTVEWEAGEGPGSFGIDARGGPARVVLGRELFPERPSRVKLRAEAGLELRGLYAAALPPGEYELADLGRTLRSRPVSPGADFDLYRWELLPEVLVLDFRDYAAQDRYLKRLAFFVEKAGYRGTLQPNSVIGPLHGWNAHDYRPEDLAAFFTAAAARGFALDPEELALKRLLAERGTIVESGKGYAAGRGALISISRESPPYLRRTFLVHESTHALFFADREYRDFVRAQWAAISPEERWFWKRYFQWMVYDTASDYLMANEYQAYLLQQPVAKAEEYFTRRLPANLLTPEVLSREPDLAGRVEQYMSAYGGTFARRASALEAWLRRKYGLSAGRTYSLE